MSKDKLTRKQRYLIEKDAKMTERIKREELKHPTKFERPDRITIEDLNRKQKRRVKKRK